MGVSLLTALLCSCGGMSGTSSLTLLTDQNEKMAKFYKPIGPEISDQQCLTSFLWIFGGTQPVHESLLARMLEENKADILMNAQFSASYVNFYLGQRQCAIIRGTPAKLKGSN